VLVEATDGHPVRATLDRGRIEESRNSYRYLRDRRPVPLGVERASSEDGVANTVSVIPG
jgi:(R)-amidase